MKSIGILTMHKVLNYGSTLQAWATLKVLKNMGYEAKLIDYLYPNKEHVKSNDNLILLIIRFLRNLYLGFPLKKKRNSFDSFWRSNYLLTHTYSDSRGLKETPPLFDEYVVGSDQVWNINYIKDDNTFFLDFVPKDKEKLSYASSIPLKCLSEEKKKSIAYYLNGFKAISVREKGGFDFIRSFYKGNLQICVDPTLLLNKDDYQSFILESKFKYDKPFLLVYILNYAFDPYPYVNRLIEKVSLELGLSVICLDFSSKQRLNVKNKIHLHDSVGPNEFLWLFSHASFVITTSFHGTAFSINFNVPFYSIINNVENGDDRMISLIRQCGLNQRIIKKDTPIESITIDDSIPDYSEELDNLRSGSLSYLKQNL